MNSTPSSGRLWRRPRWLVPRQLTPDHTLGGATASRGGTATASRYGPAAASLLRVAAVLAAFHLVGAALVLAALRDLPAGPTFGAVGLAYVWGLQHGFAADHIAAIDDSTRLLLARGQRAAGTAGLAFAAGHGVTITAATAVFVVSTRGQVPRPLEVGALVFVVLFLTVVCVANGQLVRRLTRGEGVGARGLVARMGGERLSARVDRPGHLVPVGMIFGTASVADVFVVVVVGQQGLGGGVLLPLALVVVFSAGLAVVDTVDSVAMSKAYRWAESDARRRRYANLVATSLTVVVSGAVAVIQLSTLVVDELGHPVWPLVPAAALAQRFDLVGAAIVVLFALWWTIAWRIWRRTGADPETTMDARSLIIG